MRNRIRPSNAGAGRGSTIGASTALCALDASFQPARRRRGRALQRPYGRQAQESLSTLSLIRAIPLRKVSQPTVIDIVKREQRKGRSDEELHKHTVASRRHVDARRFPKLHHHLGPPASNGIGEPGRMAMHHTNPNLQFYGRLTPCVLGLLAV